MSSLAVGGSRGLRMLWEEGNMDLRRAQSCSLGAPERQEEVKNVKCVVLEGCTALEQTAPSSPRGLFGNLGGWVLWVGQHISSQNIFTFQNHPGTESQRDCSPEDTSGMQHP